MRVLSLLVLLATAMSASAFVAAPAGALAARPAIAPASPAVFMGTGRDRPTLVEVTFEACAGGTRVVVQHHAHLAADDFERTAPRFHAGWGLLLPAFADHLLTSESP